MIGWGDIYKVVVAMAPLYMALGLGYGSVKWWRIFKPEQCEAINKLVVYFTLPCFTFEFTLHIDPFGLNYRFMAADAISKLVIVLVIAAWAKCSTKGSYCWSITTFSLSNLTNSLVVGVPLLTAMYGPWAQDLVVQSSVMQSVVWITLLLFVLEVRKARSVAATVAGDGGDVSGAVSVSVESPPLVNAARMPSYWSVMKVVCLKLVINPNIYASVLGLAWAFVATRWHLEMPGIIEGSISIMGKAGAGTAMFSLGLFMALQERIIACGPVLTLVGMVLRFVAGPVAMAIGAIAVGLHGDILRVVIIQAALPQAIVSFIFAREYGLHANVLSTAVIFGTLVSLPVLIAYYVILGFIK